MIQLGGLWKGTDKQGNEYFSGYLGNARLIIFKNGYKKEDKHPDYVMYVDENKKKGEKKAAPAATQERAWDDPPIKKEESPL